MNRKIALNVRILLILSLFIISIMAPGYSFGDEVKEKTPLDFATLDTEIPELMEEGDIPGLVLVILDGDRAPYIKGFGYADVEKEEPVSGKTLFEIASCSKAFTGFAALRMAEKGEINLDDKVSKYFPDFKLYYKGEEVHPTINHFIHQTSGLPTSFITYAKRSKGDNALKNMISSLSGAELTTKPGEEYQYCTINYDVVGAVIEKVSGIPFEQYMVENVFKPLDLSSTFVGVDQENPPPGMAKGYKIGYFAARSYVAPQYRSNNAAGYVVTNGNDLSKWLKFNIGATDSPYNDLLEKFHEPSFPMVPSNRAPGGYAMGWTINQFGKGRISHAGLNPNFTSFFILNKTDKRAVGVIANSNSSYTGYIGNIVFNKLYNIKRKLPEPRGDIDKSLSVVSLILCFFILGSILFFLSIFFDLKKGRRKFEGISLKKLANIFGVFLVFVPFVIGLTMLPRMLQGVDWEMALVWGPTSFQSAIILIFIAMGMSFVGFVFSSFFPQQNKYLRSIPSLIMLSLITGGANAVVIFLVTGSLYVTDDLVWYMVYFFSLAFLLYIIGRKVVQTQLLKIAMEIVYDLRMQLIGKVFLTSFQKFEKIDDGRVLATMNNDTGQIGQSAGLFVGLISSIITTIGVFIYLATIAFWATFVTVMVIVCIATLYYFVTRKAETYLQEARDTQNKYLALLNGMVDGFKELSLHIKKKFNYKDDLEETCDRFREKSVNAQVKLINAFLVGEALLVVVLGAVGFGVPRVFPELQNMTLMSFIIALLYLIGPINMILGAIPGILQIKIAWGRVQTFLKEIPATMSEEEAMLPLPVPKEEVKSIEATGLFFEYKKAGLNEDQKAALARSGAKGQEALKAAEESEAVDDEPTFAVGPIDFKAKQGELIFIVGGNGSGKTTFAKMLTGLYQSDEGLLKINDKDISYHQMGEYFSVVFGDFHLFNKLYEINLESEDGEDPVQKYLELLEMDHKVEVENNEFTTTNLSGGQRKRLALMQCYLEDAPIFLFDEVAADQDPQFRRFFYRELLTKMKEDGKIVIAITHDDHYFDVADRVIKLDLGKVDNVEDHTKLNITQ